MQRYYKFCFWPSKSFFFPSSRKFFLKRLPSPRRLRARVYKAREQGATSATGGANWLDFGCLQVQIGLSEVLPKMLQVLPVSPRPVQTTKGRRDFSKSQRVFSKSRRRMKKSR